MNSFTGWLLSPDNWVRWDESIPTNILWLWGVGLSAASGGMVDARVATEMPQTSQLRASSGHLGLSLMWYATCRHLEGRQLSIMQAGWLQQEQWRESDMAPIGSDKACPWRPNWNPTCSSPLFHLKAPLAHRRLDSPWSPTARDPLEAHWCYVGGYTHTFILARFAQV